LEFIKHLPDGAERARQELPVLSALGFSLGATKGYAAEELEPVYARARELCAQIHDPALDFRALLGQWVIRWTKLELYDALELADELLAAAEDVKDPAMLLYGAFARGTTLLLLGELVSGNEYLEKALAVFDLGQPLPGFFELCRICSLGYLYFGLSWLGFPDRAWAKSRQMLEVAQRSSDPFILANASNFAALHNLIRGDGSVAQRRAEEAMALVEERGFGSLSELVATWHGAALIAQGRYEEGIAGMRRAISAFRATGATPYTWNLCLLASGLGRIGRPEDGLEIVGEGFASAAKTGEQLGGPWLHRVKGELLLAQNPSDGVAAERCFRTAIEISRKQHAKSWELRASTSLAVLLKGLGRRDEARTMLAEIYGWFTEGFDTADLKDAKALLDELSN
jgi:predicted ATPase